MAQFNAGDVITFEVDGIKVSVKIEDASKGDVFSGKVTGTTPESATYKIDQVYEFDRKLVAN